MDANIVNSITKFLYFNDFEDVDIYTVYNLWLNSEHFVLHDVAKVVWVLNYIKRVQSTDKAFLREALMLEKVI